MILRTLLLVGAFVLAEDFPERPALPDEVYDHRVSWGKDAVGWSHVEISTRGPFRVTAFDLSMDVHVLGIHVPLRRTSLLHQPSNGGLMFRYWIDQKAPVPGQNFTILAFLSNETITMIRTPRGGRPETLRASKGKDWDFASGQLLRDFIGPERPKATYRLFDIEAGGVATVRGRFFGKETVDVFGRREEVYSGETAASLLPQRVRLIAANNVPLFMEIGVPVLGNVNLVLTNVTRRKSP